MYTEKNDRYNSVLSDHILLVYLGGNILAHAQLFGYKLACHVNTSFLKKG